MARTRAAMRNAVLEDPVEAVGVPLPSTPQHDRVVLGEITNNATEEPKVTLEVNLSKPSKKSSKKDKKRNANKGSKENRVEVLEDEYQSSSSSAVDEACKDLLSGKTSDSEDVILDHVPRTPPSKAVKAALKGLTPKPQTPRFNPEVHKAPQPKTPRHEKDDSFVALIESRTPARITQQGAMETGCEQMPEAEVRELDAPKTAGVERETSPRIEDSVEALDALEDAIEEVGKTLDVAAVAEKPKTGQEAPAAKLSMKQTSNPVVSPKPKRTAANSARAAKKLNGPPPQKQPAKASQVGTKPLGRAVTSATTKVTASRPSVARPSLGKTGQAPPKTQVRTATTPPKPATSSSTPKANTPVARTKPKQRVSSVSKAPFVPTKSTKQPTRSSFILPGEAISAKLKEQREERLKREAQDATKQREFKAKPVRTSVGSGAPQIRATRTSQARASLMKGELSTTAANSSKAISRPRVPSNQSRSPPPLATKTSLHARVSPSGKAATTTSTVRRSPSGPAATSKTATVARRVSPTTQHSAKTASEVAPAAPKVDGKAVFGRVRADLAAKEKARKEKEEATKRARAEAAERGRAASKEWAEKQKAKKAAASASTSALAVATAASGSSANGAASSNGTAASAVAAA